MVKKHKRIRHAEEVIDAIAELFYKHRPVDILQFLTDTYYLGKFTSGLKNIYPGWKRFIIKLERTNNRHIVVLRCPKGVGTSFIIYGCYLPYIMHRILCLKDPWEFFQIDRSGKLDIVFFNSAGTLDQHKGFNYMQNALSMSPWFKKVGGNAIRNGNQSYIEFPLFRWVFVSPYKAYDGDLGNSIVAGVIETAGTDNDYEGHKKMITKAFDSTVRKPRSYLHIGKLFVITTWDNKLTFLEEYACGAGITNNIYLFQASRVDICPDRYINSGPENGSQPQAIPADSAQEKPKEEPAEPKESKADIVDSMLFPVPVKLNKLGLMLKNFKKEKNENTITW